MAYIMSDKEKKERERELALQQKRMQSVLLQQKENNDKKQALQAQKASQQSASLSPLQSISTAAKHGFESGINDLVNDVKQAGITVSSPMTQNASAGNALFQTLVKNPNYQQTQAQKATTNDLLSQEIAQEKERKQQTIDQKYNPSEFGFGQRLVSSGVASGINMIPYLATSVVNPVAGAATTVLQYQGNKMNEALNKGASMEDAKLSSAGSGLVGGAIEMAGGSVVGNIRRLGANMAKSYAKDAVKNATKEVAKKEPTLFAQWLKGAGEEGLEEVAQSLSDWLFEHATYNPDAEIPSVEELGENFLMGAILGGVMGGVPTLVNARLESKAKQTTPIEQHTTQPIEQNIQNGENVQQNVIDRGEINPLQQPDVQQKIVDVQNHNFKALGNRGTDALMYQVPQLKPYYQGAAEQLLEELGAGSKGVKEVVRNDKIVGDSFESDVYVGGSKRKQHKLIEALLDNGMSYAQIEDGLGRIIHDEGQENVANAKRVEAVLDDMLRNGYQSMADGQWHDADNDYLRTLNGETVERQTNTEVFGKLEVIANSDNDYFVVTPQSYYQLRASDLNEIAKSYDVNEINENGQELIEITRKTPQNQATPSVTQENALQGTQNVSATTNTTEGNITPQNEFSQADFVQGGQSEVAYTNALPNLPKNVLPQDVQNEIATWGRLTGKESVLKPSLLYNANAAANKGDMSTMLSMEKLSQAENKKQFVRKNSIHENVHLIKDVDQNAWNNLVYSAFDYLEITTGKTREQLINEKIASYGRNGKRLDVKGAEEEVVTRFCEEHLPDSEAIRKLCQENETIAQRILSAIRQIIGKMQRMLMNAEQKRAFDDLRAIEEDFVQGLDSLREYNNEQRTKLDATNEDVGDVYGMVMFNSDDITDNSSSNSQRLFVDRKNQREQHRILYELHKKMVANGDIVSVSNDDISDLIPYYDNNAKADRKAMRSQLRDILKKELGALKGVEYSFDINGDIIIAELTSVGIGEVFKRFNSIENATVIRLADKIFRNAKYAYSTNDKNNAPNVKQWDYFYTPLQTDNTTDGVLVKVKEILYPPKNQIYHWGEKKEDSLAQWGSFDSPTENPVFLPVATKPSSDENIIPQGDNKGNIDFNIDEDTPKKRTKKLPNSKYIAQSEENLAKFMEGSHVVNENGTPKVVYSGHGNTNLFGDSFNIKNATSGGFYFTEDADIASSYAKDKMGNMEYWENGDEYRFKNDKGKYTNKLADIRLTDEQAEKFDEWFMENLGWTFKDFVAERERYDSNYRRMRYTGGKRSLANIFYIMNENGYTLPQTQYNADGTTYGESQFEELMNDMGIEWDSYTKSSGGVFPVYLSIKNPVDTSKPIPEDLMAEFRKAAMKDRKLRTFDEEMNAHWTKDYPMRRWVEDIERMQETGEETYWATQVPTEARKIMLKLGYDGIKDTGGKNGGAAHTVWIALEPTQVKSAIGNRGTYDATKKSMMYSIDEDSTGKELSQGQKKYFANSKVVDDQGRLLKMYHGTPNGGFTVFKSGTYFTSNPQYASVYQNPSASSFGVKQSADNPMNYEVYLNIKKPFDTRNPREREIFEKEFYRKYGTGTPLGDKGLPDWVDGMDLQEFIEDMGYDYDGLILDEGGTGGYGDEVQSRGISYVVFDSNQVKDVNNLNPTEDGDMRYSLDDSDGNQLSSGQQTFFKNSKVRDEQGRLLKLYHGTENAGFTVFDRDYSGTGHLFFTTKNIVAKGYSATTKTISPRKYTFDEAEELLRDNGYTIVKNGDKYDVMYADDYDLVLDTVDTPSDAVMVYEKDNGLNSANYTVYVNLENPYIFDANDSAWDELDDGNGNTTTIEIADWAEANGYDGVIIENVYDYGLFSPASEWIANGSATDVIAFNSNQIKSTANLNPTDDNDMRYSMDELVDEYGAMPKGENPFGENIDIDVPKSTDGDNKVRRFTRTAMESASVDQVTREILEGKIKATKGVSDVAYVPIGNKETVAKAGDLIAQQGVDGALESFKGMFNGGKMFTATDIAQGELLVTELQKQGRYDEVADLIGDLAVIGTELGRSVQALSLLKRMTPEGKLLTFVKSIDRINADLIEKGVKENGQQVQVQMSEGFGERFLQARGSREQQRLMDEEREKVAQQIPSGFKDKLDAWRYTAMLLNPTTHIRNIMGNAVMYGVRNIQENVRGGIEKGFGLPRTTTAGFSAPKEYKAFAEKVLKTIGEERLKAGGSKYNDAQDSLDVPVFKTKPLEAMRKFNSNALEQEDMFFKKKVFISALARYMAANGMKMDMKQFESNPRYQEAVQYAEKQAFRATFQEESELANTLNKLEQKNLASKVIVGGMIPFKKTPINILKTGVRYSPIGIGNGLYKEFKALQSGEKGSADAIEEIASGLTGTGIMALGMFLYSAGVLASSSDDDDKKHATYESNMGEQEYSLNFVIDGVKYSFSIDWMSPSVMPLLAGAELMRELEKLESDEKAFAFGDVMDSLVKIGDPILETSMMQGITNALQSYASGSGNYLSDTLTSMGESYAGQFVPTIGGKLNKIADDTKRTTYVPKDSPMPSLEKIRNNALSKVNSKALEPVVDYWGNEVQNEFAGNLPMKAFNNLISPSTIKSDKRTPLDDQLEELYRLTGDNGVIPTKSQTYADYTEDGEQKKIYMKPVEYTRYSKTEGQKRYNYVNDFMNSSAYNQLGDTTKADIISKLYSLAKYEAQKELFTGRGLVKDTAEYEKVLASGVKPYEYYYIKEMQKEAFGSTAMDYKDAAAKLQEISKVGFTNEQYNKEWTTINGFTAKDNNGKTVSGLKKQRVKNYLNQQYANGNLTKQQALYLYSQMGYK